MLRKLDYRLSTICNKKIQIWHSVKSTTKNKLGIYPVEDTLYKTVYAGVIPQTGSLLRGREADTTLSRTTHRFIMRYRNDLKPDMWFVYGGQRYDILYIMDTNLDHERLEVFCEVVI